METQTSGQLAYPCDWPGCTASFSSPQGKSLHISRSHRMPQKTREEILARKKAYNAELRARNVARGLTTAGKPRKLNLPKRKFPSDSLEYRRNKYQEQKLRYRAKGLRADGKPFSSRISPKGLRNIARAQKQRRQREKASLLNGAAAPAQPEADTIGESARAILVAAQVIRSVNVGMKL